MTATRPLWRFCINSLPQYSYISMMQSETQTEVHREAAGQTVKTGKMNSLGRDRTTSSRKGLEENPSAPIVQHYNITVNGDLIIRNGEQSSRLNSYQNPEPSGSKCK